MNFLQGSNGSWEFCSLNLLLHILDLHLVMFTVAWQVLEVVASCDSDIVQLRFCVCLLGGLMALGYTIATILKRSSHVFFNDGLDMGLHEEG
ncbi:hypothetical protein RchiOBHm_Chr4g0414911 [Rosa chinensis]|uniref:Uncharacterized protein n=1 Tax=Rosa chinensis TaxID=74649 RepID=A0A2P6QWJ9_ROSCH|nr:hypothetical protein RchiOBHm_Chr4g0414911 [Rosa chinensis]